MKKALVFFSGGVDSWIHLNWAIEKYGKPNVQALYVNFGHQYVKKEIHCASLLAAQAGVHLSISEDLSIGRFENKIDSHLPLRNSFLLLYGTYFADDIVFGMLHHESSEDKNESYIKLMQGLLDSQFKPTIYNPGARERKIICPFRKNTKTEMVKWYLDKGYPRDMLKATVGCYTPQMQGTLQQCGKCLSCFNRWVAFTNNGFAETYFLGLPNIWAIDQMTKILGATDKKSEMVLSLRQLFYKRRWFKEIYKAFRMYGEDTGDFRFRRPLLHTFMEYRRLAGEKECRA